MARGAIGREPRPGCEQRHIQPTAKADMPSDEPDRQEIERKDMQIVTGHVIEPANGPENDQGQSPEKWRGLEPAPLRARKFGHSSIKYPKCSPVNPSPANHSSPSPSPSPSSSSCSCSCSSPRSANRHSGITH